jgi:hypothetical protein
MKNNGSALRNQNCTKLFEAENYLLDITTRTALDPRIQELSFSNGGGKISVCFDTTAHSTIIVHERANGLLGSGAESAVFEK